MIFALSRFLLSQSGITLSFKPVYVFFDTIWIGLAVITLGAHGLSVASARIMLLLIYTLAVCLTDFKFQIIPDVLTYVFVAVGIVFSLATGSPNILRSLTGSVFGLLLFWSIAGIGKAAFHRQVLGGGDIKMAAMLGTFIEWHGVILGLFIGSVAALLYAAAAWQLRGPRSVRELPFGPFIAGAGLITIMWGEQLLAAYRSAFGI